MKTSAYLVLGLLRFGAGSGYAVKKAADISARFFWTTSLAQVYPDLARLEEQGLVNRREEPRGARPRSVYKVTKKGEEALLHWLASSREQAPQYRDEGVLRLFFADALPPKQQGALVRRLAERAHRGEQQIEQEILPIAASLAEKRPSLPTHHGAAGRGPVRLRGGLDGTAGERPRGF